MNQNRIVCNNVTKSFGRKKVLNDLSITLSHGINLLAGKNGAGKSTLIYAISGLERINSGRVFLNGVDPLRHHRQCMKNVGLMTEKPSFFGSTMVWDYIRWFSKLRGVNREEIKDYISFFDINEVLDMNTAALSMGQSQLLQLSCYLAGNFEVYILDEPNSNVDASKRKLIARAVRDKKMRDQSLFLISTHIFDEFIDISDTILLLKDGSLETVDSSAEGKRFSVLTFRETSMAIEKIRRLDQQAKVAGNAIITSLSLEDCLELTGSGHDNKILRYSSIPGGLIDFYE